MDVEAMTVEELQEEVRKNRKDIREMYFEFADRIGKLEDWEEQFKKPFVAHKTNFNRSYMPLTGIFSGSI